MLFRRITVTKFRRIIEISILNTRELHELGTHWASGTAKMSKDDWRAIHFQSVNIEHTWTSWIKGAVGWWDSQKKVKRQLKRNSLLSVVGAVKPNVRGHLQIQNTHRKYSKFSIHTSFMGRFKPLPLSSHITYRWFRPELSMIITSLTFQRVIIITGSQIKKSEEVLGVSCASNTSSFTVLTRQQAEPYSPLVQLVARK